MSLRGKEVRPLIDAELHERLSIMAEHREMQINEFASRLLEKAVAGEWHEIEALEDDTVFVNVFAENSY